MSFAGLEDFRPKIYDGRSPIGIRLIRRTFPELSENKKRNSLRTI